MPHNDERLEALEATVAALDARLSDVERRLAEHESMRSGAVDALSGVQDRLARIQDRVAALPQHPAVVARQQAGTLDHYARLSARVGGLEAAFHEHRSITVELFELVRQCADDAARVRQLVERFNKRLDQLPG